jgi:glycosyltransferase involved in cell wall biosynthesis
VRFQEAGLIRGDFSTFSLGVLTHKACWRDAEGIKTTGGFGRQLEEFARYFDHTVLLVPFQVMAVPTPGYVIHIKNLQLIPLPRFNGTGACGKLDFLAKLPLFMLRIWNAYPSCDIWQIRLPGLVGLLGILVHRMRRSRRCFIWLGTDWAERIRESGSAWPRRWLARLANGLIDLALKETPTFALGKLADKHKSSNMNIHKTISTIITAKELTVEKRKELANPPRLLFVGRLAVEKGVYDLLEAVNIARRGGLTLDLTMIGDGPERKKLESLGRQYGLENRMHFKGYIPAGKELWRWYSVADIFILPSLSEAQGKVLIEAMAAGLPIIATSIGGIPSIIEHGRTGLLVPPHAPNKIVDEICNLIRDAGMRKLLAECGLAAVRSSTIETQTEKIMSQLAIDFSLPRQR